MVRQETVTLRWGLWIALPVLAGMGLIGCDTFGPPEATSQPAETSHNRAYTEALAVADAFCQAWQQGQEAAGKSLLSTRMIRQHTDRQLRLAIVGEGNPRHVAYEISNGHRQAEGRYTFDVRWYYFYQGGHADRIESSQEKLVIANEPTGRWAVDAFNVPQEIDTRIRSY